MEIERLVHTEEERVADATVLAEFFCLCFKCRRQLRRAYFVPAKRVHPAPRSKAVRGSSDAPGIADFLDEMILQERNAPPAAAS